MCTCIFFTLNSYPMDPVSLNPTRAIQHYVIKFVSDLRQVSGFLWVLHVFSTNLKYPLDLILALNSYHFGPIFALKQVPMDSILVPNSYPVNPIFSLNIYPWVHFYSINYSYPMYPIFALKNAVFKSNMASNTGHRTHLMGGIIRII